MTRFARAKGSKASNIKTPGDSTPWEIMKEQLIKSKKESEEAPKREEAEKQRVENYNKFLKELKTQKRQATWCDFPDTGPIKKPKIQAPDIEMNTKKNKKNKAKTTKNLHVDTKNDDKEPATNTKKLKNKKNRGNKVKLNTETIDEKSTNVVSREANKNSNVGNNLHAENSNVKKKQKNKLKDKPSLAGDNIAKSEDVSVVENISKTTKNEKKQKQLNGKPAKRKEINDRSFEFIINGKNVELVRFDGFPIMKKDAERLQELKNNMIKKGIPKSEVQKTMKLERRRAEKCLARMKREVCYNCRKGGHNLSDCPDLKSNIPGRDGGQGICFKCGSTEHRQFECKVQRDTEFRFATCFICKESGHIARQCPDNPKGLYPNGGNCKLCGDVTHLRKDCPTVKDQREESTIKLQTLDTDNVEDIGQQVNKVQIEKQKKPKKITF